MTMVAPLREHAANGAGCLVCDLPEPQRLAVNGAIWDGRRRAQQYRVAGRRAYQAQTGELCDLKVIGRHADHVEKTWHEATPKTPAAPGEAPVFATDYKSITERAALLGVQAMEVLGEMIDSRTLEARELVNLAKSGLLARQAQENIAASAKRPQLEIRAIFAIGSGHAEGWPEHEVIDVTPVEVLYEEVGSERAALKRLQSGEAPAEGNAFDALFES